MPQRILVIDDTPETHTLVKSGLEGESVEIVSALNAREGLKAAREHAPDIILLDINMPEIDGFELCKTIKDDAHLSSIPIIFLSVAASTSEKTRGLNLGATDYITKPFDPAELRARVCAGLRTKYLMDLLSQRAMCDALTGLWNRQFFESRLEAELALSQRSGLPVACLMIDLDHFKSVNDRFGRAAGDLVLAALARTLNGHCRGEDQICRYGGEEFIVIAPNTDAARAVPLAERLRNAVQSMQVFYRGVRIAVTCSVGVADRTCGANVDSIVAAADAALYRGKTAGRNRVQSAAADAIVR